MSDERTRSTLKKALEGTRPDAARLEMRAPAMMAAAASRRGEAADAGVLSVMVPLARRALPAMGAAAALLTVAAGVSWWQRALGSPDAPVETQASLSSILLDGYQADASEDPLAAALMGDES